MSTPRFRVSGDKRLVDFLGDCSKHCLTVSVLYSVLTDRSRPLRPSMLSCTFLVSLNLSNRQFVLRLDGAFFPGKLIRDCRWLWKTDFVAKQALTILILSFTEYLVGLSIEAGTWNFGAPTMIYLQNRKSGLISLVIISIITWIHVFGPPYTYTYNTYIWNQNEVAVRQLQVIVTYMITEKRGVPSC